MKRVYKTTALVLMVTAASFAFAQNIELPDVTTVIEGDSIKAGLDTLPEFNDVLVVEGNSGKVVPKLPEVDAPEDSAPSVGSGDVTEKTIFAEGLIGGGYPTLFEGNFSVFRMTGESPFKLEFDYNSSNGYAGHALTDGFYDRNTKLLVEKSYKKDKLSWGANGFYQATNDGLQNRVEGMSSINHEVYDVNGNVAYELGKGFTTGAFVDVDFYNRYADVTKGIFPTVAYLDLNPQIFVSWEGYGTTVKFDADYLFGTDANKHISAENLHRGEFKLSADWSNDFIKIYENASAVVGNNIGNNSVIVPFTLGLDSTIPVPFSTRKLTIGACGGIDSKQLSLYETENKYRFTAATFVLPEESDWYGKLAVMVPYGEGFTGNFDVEYRQTAFGNRLWNPDYTNLSEYGCYNYSSVENKQVNTNLTLSYHYKFITVTGGWKAHWLNVPALETQNKVSVDVNFQDDYAKWGADLNAEFGLGDKTSVPVVNLEGFVRITPAVRAVVAVNDIVELMKAEQRVYAGSYIGRSGNVSALLKFFF